MENQNLQLQNFVLAGSHRGPKDVTFVLILRVFCSYCQNANIANFVDKIPYEQPLSVLTF